MVSTSESPDDIVLALCASFESKIPSIIKVEEEVNFMDSMEVCCHQEKDRFNKLICNLFNLSCYKPIFERNREGYKG